LLPIIVFVFHLGMSFEKKVYSRVRRNLNLFISLSAPFFLGFFCPPLNVQYVGRQTESESSQSKVAKAQTRFGECYKEEAAAGGEEKKRTGRRVAEKDGKDKDK